MITEESRVKRALSASRASASQREGRAIQHKGRKGRGGKGWGEREAVDLAPS